MYKTHVIKIDFNCNKFVKKNQTISDVDSIEKFLGKYNGQVIDACFDKLGCTAIFQMTDYDFENFIYEFCTLQNCSLIM